MALVDRARDVPVFVIMADTVDLDSILADYGINRHSLVMQGRIAVRDRNIIATKIGDWKSCAAFLDLSDQDIGDITDEHRRIRQRRMAMLRQWDEQNGREATYLRLAEALARIYRRDLVEDLVSRALRSGHNWTTRRLLLHRIYENAVSCKYTGVQL